MPKSRGIKSDPVADVAARLSDLDDRLDRVLTRAIKLRVEIEEAIGKLEGSERVLMRLRYIEGKSWEQVAVEMNYSYYYVVKELHSKALQKLKYPKQPQEVL